MRSMLAWPTAFAVVASLLVTGCGDETNPNDDGSGASGAAPGVGGSGAEGATGGMAGVGGMGAQGGGGGRGPGPGSGGGSGMIPDPGNVMNGEWTDVEPNDLPSQAVPQGILTGPIWAGFVQPYTAINPADDVDYFVFKTGAAATLDNVYMSLCWGFAGNLLDMNLFAVEGGQQGMLVKASTSTAPGCETLVDFGTGSMVLTADTTYLLEVLGAPGLDLMGDEGLYSA